MTQKRLISKNGKRKTKSSSKKPSGDITLNISHLSITDLEAKIHFYEDKYGFSTSTMLGDSSIRSKVTEDDVMKWESYYIAWRDIASKPQVHMSEIAEYPQNMPQLKIPGQVTVFSSDKGSKGFFAKEFEKRNIATETNAVAPGETEAKSSHEALYFYDIPPELIRRIGQRYTGGHKKYGVKHTNLNWRIGLTDPKYIADRFNHLVFHLLDFMENMNDNDDNLGGIAWAVGFLMEVERLAPNAFRNVFGQCKLFGESAKLFRSKVEAGELPSVGEVITEIG